MADFDLKKFGIVISQAEVDALEAKLNNLGQNINIQNIDEVLKGVKVRENLTVDPWKVDDQIMVHNNVPITLEEAAKRIEQMNREGLEAIEQDLYSIRVPYWISLGDTEDERARRQAVVDEIKKDAFFKDRNFTKSLNSRSGTTTKLTPGKGSAYAATVKALVDKETLSYAEYDKSQSYIDTLKQVFNSRIPESRHARYLGGKTFGVEILDPSGKGTLIFGKVTYTPHKFGGGKSGDLTYDQVAHSITTDKEHFYDPLIPEFKNMGHIIGESNREALTDAATVLQLIQKIEDNLSLKAAAGGDTSTEFKKLKKWQDQKEDLLRVFKDSLVGSVQHDLAFIHANTGRSSSSSTLSEYDKIIAEAIDMGAPTVKMIVNIDGTSSSTSRDVKTSVNMTVDIGNPSEPAGINHYRGSVMKSEPAARGETRGRTRSSAGHVAKVRDSMGLVLKSLLLIIYTPGSSSLFTEAMLKELAIILTPLIGLSEAKKILAAIKQQQRRELVNINVKIKKPKVKKWDVIKEAEKVLKARHDKYARSVRVLHKKFRDKEKARIDRELEKARRLNPSAGKSSVNYVQVVNQINSKLRQAVIAEMGPDSLMNRTGKFASSAKVTRASEKSLNFIYERNPYGVFRTEGGDERVNHPRTRDPGKIIRAAIRSVAVNSFSSVLRDKLYIKEDV